MTEIKRFDMRGNTWPSDDGSIVSYKDHAAIVDEKDARISALQEQVRELAAERDGSLKAIADIYMAVIGGRPGWSNWQAYLDDIVEEVSTTLREIRAQAVDAFAADCKVKASNESLVFWMDASSAAEEYAARIRAGDQP